MTTISIESDPIDIGDFLDAVAAGHDPLITGEEALNMHRLIDALIQAGETGQPVAVATG